MSREQQLYLQRKTKKSDNSHLTRKYLTGKSNIMLVSAGNEPSSFLQGSRKVIINDNPSRDYHFNKQASA